MASSSFFLLLAVIIFLLMNSALAARSEIYTISSKNVSESVKRGTYTWHEFGKFTNANKGSFVSGISELKKYFRKFGYLEEEDVGKSTDVFDGKLENAIRNYQRKLEIPVTGRLDSPTIAAVMSPRCGVPDGPPLKHRAKENYVYFTGKPRWSRSTPMTLTYAISPDYVINSLSKTAQRAAFGRAFTRWAAVTPITFVETRDYGFSDIKIGFYRGDHGDGEAFDGMLGVLAHAFSPESGRFHLDAAETWALDFEAEKSEAAVDLESVATHEIGHLLGLAHSEVKEAVMYPNLRPRQRKTELTVDDIRGVQALYGSNPNFSLLGFSESDMHSNMAGEGIPIRVLNWGVGLVFGSAVLWKVCMQ